MAETDLSNINPGFLSISNTHLIKSNDIATTIDKWAYTSNYNINTSNVHNINYIKWIKDNIPIIYYIKSFKTRKDNKIEIEFYNKIRFSLFLLDNGSLLFSNDFYGIYCNKDYHYWANKVLVEFNSGDENRLTKDILFTQANQFDLKLSNGELLNFLKNNDDYKDFVHIRFEEHLNSLNFKDMEEKKNYHNELDKLI